ncbi:MAG TPA: DedA family protein [Candidatus Aminicenantes bacterium]|nr:DedA family protein [Candidatus Aminicenantes bacterium]
MKNNKNISGPSPVKPREIRSKIRTLIFALQIIVVAALLVVWLSSESIQKSKDLWVLFIYSFPSQFLIPIIPHEPVLFYFGKFYSPLTVALVDIAGTLLIEALNYSVFKYIIDTSFFQKMRQTKSAAKVVELFNRAPFVALLVAGLTPVPFYPFRFLVVMAHYPIWKYLLAIFLSRTPRFYVLALIGRAINIPDYLIIVIFIILIVSVNGPILRRFLKNRQGNKTHAS